MLLDTVAWMYHLNRQPEKAKHWIERAAERAPDNEEIIAHRKLINQG